MSRFKINHNGTPISAHPSVWEAREAAVAYMRANKVSPIAIVDSENLTEFNTSHVHIQAFEGDPEVVAARDLIRAKG